MRARTIVTFGGALALLAPAAAMAGEPVYFHKANVRPDAFAADLAYCLDLAKGVRAPAAPYVYTPNLYAAAAAGFFAGIMRSRERRHMIDSVLRTCMTDKGYRRVEATKALGKELDGLSEKARTERFYALAGAPEPEGKVLPQ